MGRNPTNQVKCPRCGKRGTLRLKQKNRRTVVVYHYDKTAYKQFKTSGTKFCYVGSIDSFAKSFLSEIQDEKGKTISDLDQNWLKETMDRFQKELQNTDNNNMILNKDMTRFAEFLNEARKIRNMLKKETKIQKHSIQYIQCGNCRHPIDLKEYKGVEINNRFYVLHKKYNTL